jgi:hypothetical protein
VKSPTYRRLMLATAMAGIVMCVVWTWNSGKKVAVPSCVASLSNSLTGMTESELQVRGSCTESWQQLESSEATRVLSAVRNSDCAGVRRFGSLNPWKAGKNEQLYDPWGNTFKVAIRCLPSEQDHVKRVRQFQVWSSGPDGIPGTDDDIRHLVTFDASHSDNQ